MRTSPPLDYIDSLFADRNGARPAAGAVDSSTEFLHRAMRLGASLERTLASLCAPYELTTAQFHALIALRRCHPTALTAADLMRATVLSSGTVTFMLKQMQKKKLIEQGRNPRDQRQIQVRLTAKGKTLAEKVHVRRERELASLARALRPKERADISVLLRLLLKDLDPA